MTKLRILVIAVALAVVGAGVGVAAIPSANGTISACRDNKGALKVIDVEAGQGCGSNQQLLTWSQQGPAGATGPRGFIGFQGPAGPPGPTIAYLGYDDAGGNVYDQFATVGGALELPAGEWILSAKVYGQGSTISDETWLLCHLDVDDITRDASAAVNADGYAETVVLQGAHIASSPFEVRVRCRDAGGGTRWNNVKITALLATDLHAAPL